MTNDLACRIDELTTKSIIIDRHRNDGFCNIFPVCCPDFPYHMPQHLHKQLRDWQFLAVLAQLAKQTINNRKKLDIAQIQGKQAQSSPACWVV